jgi:hypothetical protein
MMFKKRNDENIVIVTGGNDAGKPRLRVSFCRMRQIIRHFLMPTGLQQDCAVCVQNGGEADYVVVVQEMCAMP